MGGGAPAKSCDAIRRRVCRVGEAGQPQCLRLELSTGSSEDEGGSEETRPRASVSTTRAGFPGSLGQPPSLALSACALCSSVLCGSTRSVPGSSPAATSPSPSVGRLRLGRTFPPPRLTTSRLSQRPG